MLFQCAHQSESGPNTSNTGVWLGEHWWGRAGVNGGEGAGGVTTLKRQVAVKFTFSSTSSLHPKITPLRLHLRVGTVEAHTVAHLCDLCCLNNNANNNDNNNNKPNRRLCMRNMQRWWVFSRPTSNHNHSWVSQCRQSSAWCLPISNPTPIELL